MTQYQWIPGRGRKVDAQVVGDEVEAIRRRDGVCSTQALVDHSRPDAAPTHPLFEWDDSIAAERFRNHQARDVVRSIRVIADSDSADDDGPPAFVHVKLETDDGDPMHGYYPSVEAMREPSLRAQVVREIQETLAGWRRRYRTLSELAPVWAAIDDAISAVSADEAEQGAA